MILGLLWIHKWYLNLDLAKKFEQREKEWQEEVAKQRQHEASEQQAGNKDLENKVGLLESQLEDLQDLLKSKQR